MLAAKLCSPSCVSQLGSFLLSRGIFTSPRTNNSASSPSSSTSSSAASAVFHTYDPVPQRERERRERDLSYMKDLPNLPPNLLLQVTRDRKPRQARTWALRKAQKSAPRRVVPLSAQALHAELSAVRARINVGEIPLPLLVQAVTHPAFRFADSDEIPVNNAVFEAIGSRATIMYTTEYFEALYPNMQPPQLEACLGVYLSEERVNNAAFTTGLTRCLRVPPSLLDPKTHRVPPALGVSVFHAVVGLLYSEVSPRAARDFIHIRLLARKLDILPALRSDTPRKDLKLCLTRTHLGPAEYRIIDHVGRGMNALQMFRVGVFSGKNLLAEGVANTEKAAYNEAAQNALLEHYTTTPPNATVDLPSNKS